MPSSSFCFIGNGTGVGVETVGWRFVAVAETTDACLCYVPTISNAQRVIDSVSIHGALAKEVYNGR